MQQDAKVNTANQVALSIRNLEVTYGTGNFPVLRDVSFDLHRGERIAIVGQSGSGKSTTIAAILGLLPGEGRISNGDILLDGNNVTQANETQMRNIRGREIGLVPQDPMSNLNPSMKVGAQIVDALWTYGLRDRKQAKLRAIELMAEAGIPEPEHRFSQYPHEFSGGMRQRVLIAISLAGEPLILIADEPTSALDVTVQKQILNHLQSLVDDRGTSLLFVTHDLGLAADRTDRIIVMADGRIVEIGTPEEIFLNPQEEYTRALIDAAPSVDVSDFAQCPEMDKGKHTVAVQTGLAETAPLLEVRDLVKEFKIRGRSNGSVRAVDNVSFTLERGRTLAIVGESGSGKTTLSRIILGLEEPTSGTSLLMGKSLTKADAPLRKSLRRIMQPVFQNPYGSLNPTYSIERLIDEPLRIFGIGDRVSRRRRVAELLESVALPRTVAQRRPHQLSGGQRQRVAIARALALEPELIICDEAVSALDVLVQDQILRLLVDLQDQFALSYLFVTHDLSVVREIAHEVLVMKNGMVVEKGSLEQVFSDPQADYTKDLLGAIPGAEFSR